MPLWTRFTFPLLVLGLGACVETPDEVISSGGVGSSSTTNSATTMPKPGTTTMQGEDTQGTQGGTGTTIGVADTTQGTSSSAGETTVGVDPSSSSGGGSSSSGLPPECNGPGQCPNNETCDGAGQCVSACDPWGDGHYGYCLTPLGTYNSAVLCGEPLTCITSPVNAPTEVVVCGRTCGSLCDCPAPPATGTAVVTCGDLVGMDGANECYLSCAAGEDCPDDMVCRGNLYCTHPVQPLAMYGNCDDIAAPCIDGVCATSGSSSVCVSLCGNVGDCDPAPAGGMGPSCNGVISPPAGADCYLPCSNGGDCPTNMVCANGGGGNLCMWP